MKPSKLKATEEQKTNVCFLLDATGSMNKYIKSVKESLSKLFLNMNDIFGENFTKIVFPQNIFKRQKLVYLISFIRASLKK